MQVSRIHPDRDACPLLQASLGAGEPDVYVIARCAGGGCICDCSVYAVLRAFFSCTEEVNRGIIYDNRAKVHADNMLMRCILSGVLHYKEADTFSARHPDAYGINRRTD